MGGRPSGGRRNGTRGKHRRACRSRVGAGRHGFASHTADGRAEVQTRLGFITAHDKYRRDCLYVPAGRRSRSSTKLGFADRRPLVIGFRWLSRSSLQVKPGPAPSRRRTTRGGWRLKAGAWNYTFTNGKNLAFVGAGIVVNGGSAAITNNVNLFFQNTSTAGAANITNLGGIAFVDNSTAGAATITNGLFLRFSNASTAGGAKITNSTTMNFFDTSTAGAASITNNGRLVFTKNSTPRAPPLPNPHNDT